MQTIFFLLCLIPFTNLQCESKKTIAIFAYKDERVGHWDPDIINSGIFGSEEAVIYMSQQLAKLGYKVIVLGNPPDGSRYSISESNPRFIKTDSDDGSTYDIAISWRMPWIGKKM